MSDTPSRHMLDLSKFKNFAGERGLETWLKENSSIFFDAVDAANESVKLAAIVKATYYENTDKSPDSFVTEAYLVPQDEALPPSQDANANAYRDEVRGDPCQMYVSVKFHENGEQKHGESPIIYRFSPTFFLPAAEILDSPASYLDSLGSILAEVMLYLWVKGTIPRDARGFLRIIVDKDQTVTCQFKPYAALGQFLYKFEHDFYGDLKAAISRYDPRSEIVVGMNSAISGQYLIGPIAFVGLEELYQSTLNPQNFNLLRSRVEPMLRNPLEE